MSSMRSLAMLLCLGSAYCSDGGWMHSAAGGLPCSALLQRLG